MSSLFKNKNMWMNMRLQLLFTLARSSVKNTVYLQELFKVKLGALHVVRFAIIGP
jgi:hypothetical protein